MSSRFRRSTQSGDMRYSGTSLPGLLVGREEFNEVRDTMRSILKRLDTLEQVFVFLDIEQINKVLKKACANLDDKAGLGSVSQIGHWEPMPACEEGGSKSPTETGSSNSRTQSCDGQRHEETGESAVNHGVGHSPNVSGPRSRINEFRNRSLQDAPTWETFSPAQEQSQSSLPIRLPPLAGPEAVSDRTHYEWEGLSNMTDDHDKTSACSTWDLCSTRSGWNDDSEVVDPGVFKKFMSQALRPKWEKRPQEVMLVQNIEDQGDTQDPQMSAVGCSRQMSNSEQKWPDP